jgi:3-oxocholest-4-en-26-oyl-CoA dehydrogenase alpha subunit
MSTPDMFGRVAIAQTMRDVAPDLMDILGTSSSVSDEAAEYIFRLAGPTGI